jgi:hypothetical protein
MGQITPEEKKGNQRVALTQLYTIKSLNNKNKCQESPHTYQYYTECQRTQLPHKRLLWQTGLKMKIQQSVVYQRPILLTEINAGLG